MMAAEYAPSGNLTISEDVQNACHYSSPVFPYTCLQSALYREMFALTTNVSDKSLILLDLADRDPEGNTGVRGGDEEERRKRERPHPHHLWNFFP
jgi:hypothetical protein